MKRQIIINADDFGLTSKVNEAVIKCHQMGVLTSATIMANGLAVEEAARLAKANPKLGVGVHLNLTVLKPILPSKDVPSLVNRQGHFEKKYWKLPFKNLSEVKQEWRAQIKKILSLGIIPTHLDSHHHIHLYPPFTKIVLELSREFNINSVRLISPESVSLMKVKGIQRKMAIQSWEKSRGEVNTPQTVLGVENYTHQMLRTLIDGLLEGVHEMYLHPGYLLDPQLVGVSSLVEQREKDLHLLTDPVVNEIFNNEVIELVNYSCFTN